MSARGKVQSRNDIFLFQQIYSVIKTTGGITLSLTFLITTATVQYIIVLAGTGKGVQWPQAAYLDG